VPKVTCTGENHYADRTLSIVQYSKRFRETVEYATAMVATIPILMVYLFIQKCFAKRTMTGSIKG
jgi:ABC-type glycerol-3-phosphate transport system permease component